MNDRLRFGWRHSQIIWTATTEDGLIVVDDRTYERILREQLAAQGIAWKSLHEYMGPAEAAWNRQCEAVQRLQCDLDLWQSIPGVELHPRKGR